MNPEEKDRTRAESAGTRSPRRPPSLPRYLGASLLLLVLLLGTYAFIQARRLQRDLEREVHDKGLALADALETSSRNAVAANALLEESIAQRLLDNARLIDSMLLASGRLDPEAVQKIARENRLAKIEFLDPDGKSLALADLPVRGPGPMGMGSGAWMRRMHQQGAMAAPVPGPVPGAEGPPRPDGVPPMMWGFRWRQYHPPPEGRTLPEAPRGPARKFWAGSEFGVAVPATGFRGFVSVHAEADYILNFRKEIGVERLIAELSQRSGIAYISLLEKGLAVLADSRPAMVGQQETDPFLRDAMADERVRSRNVAWEGRAIHEVVKPFSLGPKAVGLLRVGLSTEPMALAWRQDRAFIILFSAGMLVIGTLGILAIFWTQGRHLREVRRLEAEAEAQRRLATVGNLAAGVAHEIRNPLNAISMGLQRLRREFTPAAEADHREYAQFTGVMQGEVRRLNDTIERFLQLARPGKLRREPCKLDVLLDELLLLVEAEAEAKHVTVERRMVLDGVVATVDPQQLRQALLNLVVNAFQAMPRGGTLTVRARRVPPIADFGLQIADLKETDPTLQSAIVNLQSEIHGDFVEIAVTDTGEGIAAEDLDRIFEPYYTTKRGGTGLGLAIARRIIEDHGGSIAVEAEAGRGTTFRILLPLGPPVC